MVHSPSSERENRRVLEARWTALPRTVAVGAVSGVAISSTHEEYADADMQRWHIFGQVVDSVCWRASAPGTSSISDNLTGSLRVIGGEVRPTAPAPLCAQA